LIAAEPCVESSLTLYERGSVNCDQYRGAKFRSYIYRRPQRGVVDVQCGHFLPGTAIVDTAWRTLDAVEEIP
jgi:hypothetical protein